VKKLKTLIRNRVNRALESIFEYPLTVVEAPIGYGKTTAVRQFLTDKGCAVLWISFLSSEDTVSFFWNSMVSEIGRLDAQTGVRLMNLGFPADAPQTANVLSILNELEFNENTVLVIDDFHLVKSSQIGSLLTMIVREQPENLHIIVITRDTTNLDISELTAKGLCNILPQHVLCFTDSELRDYCSLMNYHPNETDLKKISEYTGGWISMVYLTLLGIGQGIPVGNSDMIDDLVEKALFNTYDDSIRRFLLKLSVMDAFTAEEALFVTEDPRAEDILKKLRRENAFITYNPAVGLYRIHNVLLDFLRIKYKNNPELKHLYGRVGQWLFDHHSKAQAYAYFCRAEDFGRILELLNDTGNIDYSSPYYEGLLDLFASLPREMLFMYPFAYLQYITMRIVIGGSDGKQDGVTRLNELQTVYECMDGLDPMQKNRILAEVALIRMFSAFNDAVKMAACVKEALRLFDGGSSCLFRQDNVIGFASPHQLYTYYREPGKLKETAEFMAAELPAFSQAANCCYTGNDYITTAEYALETGDWQGAELNALKAIYKAETRNQTSLVISARLVLLRLYIYQGKTDEAFELIRQLNEDNIIKNTVYLNTALDLVKGYVYACLGRYDSIPFWLQTGNMSSAQLMFQGVAFSYIVYGKAVLLSKNYIKLEMLTEEFNNYFSVFHNQLGFLHNQILKAAAKYRLYGMDAGSAALNEAIAMAREDRIILPFAEYAPAIIDMVHFIIHSNSRDMYIKAINDACEQYMTGLKRITRSTVSLSGREIEILTLTAEGLKREEIALRLHLAKGTVKNHLENIYRKLETSGRTAAVKKARELKIL